MPRYLLLENGSRILLESGFGILLESSSNVILALTGPSSGSVGVPSGNFIVTPSAPYTGVVTPSDSGGGGVFSPSTLTFSNSSVPQTFTYTAASQSNFSISITGNPPPDGYSGSPVAYTTIPYTPPSIRIVDPDLATLISGSSVLKAIVGEAKDYPIQCWFFGGRYTAQFASNDLLVAYLCLDSQPTLPPPNFLYQPPINFFTNEGTQTGYEEGQIIVSLANANTSILSPGHNYTLIGTQSPANNPTNMQMILRMQLIVESPTLF
jgi:hypothetical protein